jgi:hypothetical protein
MALVLILTLMSAPSAQAFFLSFQFPGVSSFDGWVGLNNNNFPGYGSYPGGSAWPGMIGSNDPASGDATLARVAGGVSFNGPYLAPESIYFASLQQVPNQLGGTLRVADPTPVAGAKTVLFQIQIGEAVGYDFVSPSGRPVLKINGSPTSLAPWHTTLVDRFQPTNGGTYFSPETLQDEPVYVNTWGFQWNVNGLGPITSLEIDFSAVTHAQVYQMQLDQSETMSARNLFLPEFRVSAVGSPSFDGSQTSVTHTFASTPNTSIEIEYSGTPLSGAWTPTGPHATGTNGIFQATFTQPGNNVTTWSKGMIFRAAYLPF